MRETTSRVSISGAAQRNMVHVRKPEHVNEEMKTRTAARHVLSFIVLLIYRLK